MTKLLKCPSCGSTRVTLTSVQLFMAKTLDYFCETVKVTDIDSPAWCIDCEWEGKHYQLSGSGFLKD